MITLEQIKAAKKYNKKKSGTLWNHSQLPLPLCDLVVDSDSFALFIAQDQCKYNKTIDGKLGPDTLGLYPEAALITQKWVYGIDVSRWQGTINWHLVKQDDIEFAIIKCAQGNSQSQNFVENAKTAEAVGLTLGYYAWPTPGTDGEWDVNDEIRAIKRITDDMPDIHLPFAVDIEANKEGLSKEDYTKWMTEYCEALEGIFPTGVMLYTSKRNVDEFFTTDHTLGKYPLWCPRYGSNTGNIQDSIQPEIPHGWDNWIIWQYTSKAKVAGITTNVDKNIARYEWIYKYLKR